MMSRVKLWVVGAAVTAVILASALPASAAVLVVGKCDNRWHPSKVVITKGTTVKWKAGCHSHTVTAYSKNWSKNVTLSQGQTTRKTFNSKGTFKYRCRFHSTLTNGVCAGMCGKVVVG
jgi:plastocyanin